MPGLCNKPRLSDPVSGGRAYFTEPNMITTLSLTIHGSRRYVNHSAREFIARMSLIMGRKIKGTRLVQLERKDEKITYKQFRRRQVHQMFHHQ